VSAGVTQNRVVILGDVGGQLGTFRRCLAGIGIDPDAPVVPADMTLIQVGDVTRRVDPADALDSVGCARLSDRLLRENPGRYVQLLGNHDVALLSGAAHPDAWRLDAEAAAIVTAWWDERLCALATVVSDANGRDVLVTHAGLTFDYWDALGRPDSPHTVAATLNAEIGRPDGAGESERPGRLVTGEVRLDACTSWAELTLELLPRWLDADSVPFGQIHGHAGPYRWDQGEWWPEVSDAIRAVTVLDYDVQRSRTTVGVLPDGSAAVFESVDWMLGDTPRDDAWPLLSLAAPAR